jgi:hypothetical protein
MRWAGRVARIDGVTTTSRRPGWLLPTGLIALSLVPVAAGAFRVAQLAVGARVMPTDERFFDSPVPVLLHIVGASVFCLLGALQFAPAFRRRRIGWHRTAGRLIVPGGLIAALSGLWMAVFYPRPPGVGDLLTGERLVFGTAMAAALTLGFLAVRRRDIATHRAWMMRGYAIGQGAGTQFLTIVSWSLLVGPPGVLANALLHGASWLINLAVAEWFIRRSTATPTRTPALVLETR